jgi:hypothetical protein
MDTPLLRLIVFAITGFPLVLQDQREHSVSQLLLFSTVTIWWGWALLSESSDGRLLAATLVLVAGAVFLVLLPGRFGEADVLFVAAMACLMPFFSWMTALMAGCGAGLIAFGWLAWITRTSIRNVPVPFLPCLYWGGLTVLLGDLLV